MDQSPPVVSTLHDLGPWVLSFIALIQLWVVKAFDRWRTGTLDIFESRAIEVAHGTLGSSIGLLGTLRALTKPVFVREMQAFVQRDRDNATLSLTWWLFRSATAGRLNLEPVYGFLVAPADPFRFDLFLVDSAFVANTRGRMEELARFWREFFNTQLERMGSTPAQLAENPALSESIFAEFLNQPQPLELFNDLNRANYWEPGGYALRLSVLTADGRTFSKSWRFRLSSDDDKRLRANAIAAIREVCGLRAGYASAYPAYEPVASKT